MKQKLSLLLTALGILLSSATAGATTVTLSQSLGDRTLSMVSKKTGESVDLGEFRDYKYTVECEPGVYELSVSKDDEQFGSLEVEVLSPDHYSATGGVYEIKFGYADLTFKSNYYGVNFTRNVDFTVDAELYDMDGNKMGFTPVYTDTGMRYYYVKGWKSHIVLTPTEIHPDYAVTDFWGTPEDKLCLYRGHEIYLSFPSDADGGLFQKQGNTHYVPFIELDPLSVETEGGVTTKTFWIPMANQNFSYRVSREGSLTNAGVFTPFYTKDINVSEEDLRLVTPKWQTHDLLGGTNYADLYLNINQRGHLRLRPGDNYQIVNLRTWQLTNSTTENFFLEPDFHYTVLNSDFQPDNSVISIDTDGRISAHKKGTAIVEITYDAINIPTAYDHALWSALWAENTGTFVVTVDDDVATALPADNIHLGYKPEAPLDSEHDILYYLSGTPGYELTFTPDDGATVRVANPVVDSENNTVSYPKGFSSDNVTTAPDGSVKVLLTFGRNIIRTTGADGKSNYQVLSAKPVSREISTVRDDNYILPGDSVTVQHSGLFHLAGKLAGIYNQSCYLTFDGEACYPLKQLAPWQYTFAGNKEGQAYIVATPSESTDPISLTNGALYHYGYGSVPGSHRAVDYGRGVDPNLKAEVRSAYCGSVPDARIDFTPMADGMKLSKRLASGYGFTVLSNDAFAAAADAGPVWTSADPEIAKVDENGYVVALKEGKTTVTATNPGQSFTIECAVDVFTQLPDTLYFSGAPYKIYNKENNNATKTISLRHEPSNAVLNADEVTLTIDNEEIATITPNKKAFSYKITGLSPGTTTVTAVCKKYGLTAKAEIIVGMQASSISLEPAELTVGQKHQMVPVFLPENTTSKDVTWSSSNPVVATISNKGVITARSVGTTEITVTDKRQEGKCTVVVKDTETGIPEIELDSSEAEVYYNLEGVASERPYKGFNIVRMKDGSVRKVIVK